MRKDSDLSRVKGLSPSASGPPCLPPRILALCPWESVGVRTDEGSRISQSPKLSTGFHKFKYDGVSTSA
jgi:hypothetical protein